MTGTITELNLQRRFGSIRADDGSIFIFYDSGVIAEEFSFLKTGQEVHFEAGRGTQTRNAVRVQSKLIASTTSSVASGAERLPSGSRASSQAETLHFLYVGFEQPKNIRHYKFSAVARGQPAKLMTVSVDVALFLKYHVGIQEAPAMCLDKLSRADSETSALQHQLTEGDLATYVSDRAAAAARKLERRRWPKSRRLALPAR